MKNTLENTFILYIIFFVYISFEEEKNRINAALSIAYEEKVHTYSVSVHV